MVCNCDDKVSLHDSIRNRGDDYLKLPCFVLDYLGISATDYASSSRRVRVLNIFLAVDISSRRKIRTFNEFEQILGSRLLIFDKVRSCVDYFA